jgi:hypothetical protein
MNNRLPLAPLNEPGWTIIQRGREKHINPTSATTTTRVLSDTSLPAFQKDLCLLGLQTLILAGPDRFAFCYPGTPRLSNSMPPGAPHIARLRCVGLKCCVRDMSVYDCVANTPTHSQQTRMSGAPGCEGQLRSRRKERPESANRRRERSVQSSKSPLKPKPRLSGPPARHPLIRKKRE